MKFTRTPNYIIADDAGDFYIKVLSENRWRDAVAYPDLCSEDKAIALEEAFCAENAQEWIRKAAKADPVLKEKLEELAAKEG